MKNEFSPAELSRRDTARMAGYRELLDFYHGNQWAGGKQRGEKRLTFNYARVFVEKTTSYLMSGMTFAVEPRNDNGAAGARQAEAALHRVYEENHLEQLDLETETDCAILGDAAYKVTWDPAAGSIRVTAPDVQGLHTWLYGDDLTQVWRVASRYTLEKEVVEELYRIKPEGRTAQVVEVWTADQFELWIDNGRIEKKRNAYGFIPFVIYPNLREPKKAWGISDLAAVKESQRELNRAISQLSKILELSGNPVTVMEGCGDSDDITAEPGGVWTIPDGGKAYLLDPLQGGGTRLHLEYINLLYRVIHDLSESPRAAFGGTERDLSGVALEIELQPLLQKIRRKRLIRNTAYIRRNRMILKLLEKFEKADFGDNRLGVVWGPVLPQDRTQLAADEQVMVQNGIHSRHRAMNEMGIKDPEAEFKQWLEERTKIQQAENEPRYGRNIREKRIEK